MERDHQEDLCFFFNYACSQAAWQAPPSSPSVWYEHGKTISKDAGFQRAPCHTWYHFKSAIKSPPLPAFAAPFCTFMNEPNLFDSFSPGCNPMGLLICDKKTVNISVTVVTVSLLSLFDLFRNNKRDCKIATRFSSYQITVSPEFNLNIWKKPPKPNRLSCTTLTCDRHGNHKSHQ